MSDLSSLSVTAALIGLARGDFTSRDLTHACLAAILKHDPELRCFLAAEPEMALAAADAADARRRKGGDLPPLLGLPIAVKDVLAVEGMTATAGSRILSGFQPPYTATAVRRLLDAGVVILGKTNTDEFAMGSSTENSAFFTTHNPWNTERVPGGSSGGSAAAVAARLTPAALGSDTGGSVRQPASFCGVTGLKPTYGRVSRYGLIAYGSSLDTVGVLARGAEDVTALFNVMAGHDPLDATSADRPAPDVRLSAGATLKGLRVGVPEEYFIEGIQPEVEERVRAAIEELKTLGATVQPVNLPHTKYALPVYYLIAPAEASANLARFDGVRYGLRVENEDVIEMFKDTRGAGFGPEVIRRIMLGTYALSAGYYDAYYGQAQKVRTLIARDFLAAFEQVDVIAAPVAPTTAFKIGGHGDDPLAMYLEDVFTLPANLAGVPGLAFPVGFDAAGLPVGMQLMGRHFEEETLLQVAHAYQQTTDWHTRVPEHK
ncbi:MAG: Asp-tRNA(Asn)/Glu-tRNA(Gln) amidotransferase subunit GatA [Anaerolineae bacterium]|nr:MAG: Asp-tRNA(Asn)/Glu-tRNA(Gln) amidotransferase subunit GatA [Anaerolineae bacterium]